MGRRDGPTHGRDGNVHMADSNLGLIAMVSHLPAMLPVAVGCALAFRIREEKRVARRLVRRGRGRARRHARGDELRRRAQAARRVHLRQQPVGVLDADAPRVRDRARRRPRAGVRLRRHRRRRHRRPRGLPRGEARDREGARRRRPDADRVRDAAHGGPRRPRRRVLRPEGDARGVGEGRPDRALPHLAARERRLLRRGGGRDPGRRQEAPERRAPARRGVAAARSVRAARTASTRRPRTSTRRTTSNGREDLPPGDQRRPPRGDAPRQARVPDRRGRRRLRRRVQGVARLPGGVRAVARDRRAAQRDGDRRPAAPAPRSWACARSPRCSSRTSSRARGITSSPSRRSSAGAPARRCRSRCGCRRAAASPAGRSTRRTRSRRSRTSPGLKCVCPATPEDAKGLLVSAIEDPNPVLYFEHKHLYRRIKGEVPDERYTVPIGKARTHREGEDISVITWGAMVYTADEAAQQLEADDVSVEIVDLRTVMPWDKKAVLESARKTSKVLVLHEDTRTGGFGAEIAATIAEEAFEDLDAPREAHHGARHARAVLAAAREGVHPAGRGRRRRAARSSRSTDGHHVRRRRRHAADGRLRLGGDDHEVAEAGRRHRRGRREPARDLDRQGRHRGAVAGHAACVQEILVQEGETVDVGTKLATIAPEGAEVAPPAEEPRRRPSRATQEAAREARGRVAGRDARADGGSSGPAPRRPRRRRRPTARRSSRRSWRRSRPSTASIPARCPAPAAAAASRRRTSSASSSPARPRRAPPSSGAAARARSPPPAPEPAPPAPAPTPPEPTQPAAAQPGETLEPMTAMRRGIAEHMRRSLDTAAHVTSAIEVDMSKVVAIRAKLKKQFQDDYGVNPTYLAFVSRAVVETLRDYPWINGEIRGDQIVTRKYVNLGFAVELADGKGLIVPVVKNAEGLNLLGIARARDRHRAARARQEAAARRRAGRHVHDHEPRRLRHLPRHAGHQPAAGRDPRHVRGRQAAVGRAGRARPGRDRDPADHEPDADVRPPARRRRARRPLPARPARRSSRAGAKSDY